MPQDPQIDDEDEYASSEDSDFAPDNAPEAASDFSDSEDEAVESTGKGRRPGGDAKNDDVDGCDNSGDEAIIERGKKRRKKARAKAQNLDDDDGGEGGLIKTRRQRAAEKQERKYAANTGPVTVDVDAVWAEMMAGGSRATRQPETLPNEEMAEDGDATAGEKDTLPKEDESESAMIRIKRTYNFAGRIHTEEKLVPRDSAEAKLYLASQEQAFPSADSPPTKRLMKKAFRSAFEPVTEGLPGRTDLNLGVTARMRAGKEAQAKKLNTVEKSRMDWAGFVDKEGIKNELELAGKSKDSYAARQDFLARSEALRDGEARKVRLAGRS